MTAGGKAGVAAEDGAASIVVGCAAVAGADASAGTTTAARFRPFISAATASFDGSEALPRRTLCIAAAMPRPFLLLFCIIGAVMRSSVFLSLWSINKSGISS